MSSSTIAERSDSGSAAAKHRFSVLDFLRMAAAGILNEDDRVELIEGELFDMAPIGSKHASIVDLLVEILTLGAKGRLLVRYSGTEPKLRVMTEGEDESLIRQVAQDLAQGLGTLLN